MMIDGFISYTSIKSSKSKAFSRFLANPKTLTMIPKVISLGSTPCIIANLYPSSASLKSSLDEQLCKAACQPKSRPVCEVFHFFRWL